MTRDQQIALIWEKCLKANVALRYVEMFGHHDFENPEKSCNHEVPRPIRLADVLVAINKYAPTDVCIGKDGSFCKGDGPKVAWWNLLKDDLAEQSDECITFLTDLLK